jgi:hypothetical protein
VAKRKSEWWENAYVFNDDIHVLYELEFNKDIIKPGSRIKIKNQRGVFIFRCVAHNIKLDSTWIDCLGPNHQWHSFPIDRLKNLVKPKRSRRKKANV